MFKEGKLNRLKIVVIAEDSVLYDSPYLAQHGVSLLLATERDDVVKNVLVDMAQNPSALLENIDRMQISLSCIVHHCSPPA